VVSIEADSSCCCLIAPLDVAPVSSFIASKGRARITFVAVILLIRWEQFPCSVETYWAPLDALICTPLCRDGGRCVRLNFRSEDVRWHSCRHPRYCGGMDVVVVE
jgi:hypothetical protein